MHAVCAVCHKYSGPSQWSLALSRKYYTHGLDSDLGSEEDRERNKGTGHISCRHFLTHSCPPYHHFFTLMRLKTVIVTLLPLFPIVNVVYGWSHTQSLYSVRDRVVVDKILLGCAV